MNTTTKNYSVSSSTDELEFAYSVRRALDEQITHLPTATLDRLSAARRMAIARKKPESAVHVVAAQRKLAGSGSGSTGNPFNDSISWLVRVGIVIPLLVLIIGAFSIYKYEEARRIDELADLDVAVLSDELPLNAYLDHGFDTYLNKHGE
jgi:hypothetical protein